MNSSIALPQPAWRVARVYSMGSTSSNTELNYRVQLLPDSEDEATPSTELKERMLSAQHGHNRNSMKRRNVLE